MRRIASGACAIALVLAVAHPVAAGEIIRFSGTFAVGEWTLGTTHSFSVVVFDGSIASPPGRPAPARTVFVSGHEEFCQEETDLWVVRDFFGSDTPDSLHIDGQLMSASVSDAAVPVFLDEVYYAGCGDPDFENPTFNPHDGSVTVSAEWVANGPLVRERTSFTYDAGPDCKLSFRSQSTTRSASATASLSGDSEIDLGTEDLAWAAIAAPRGMDLEIGNQCS